MAGIPQVFTDGKLQPMHVYIGSSFKPMDAALVQKRSLISNK